MPTKLTEIERERLRFELQKYPSYIKEVFEYILQNYTYSNGNFISDKKVIATFEAIPKINA